MSDSTASDADKIRNKRLAKLGTSGPSQATPSATDASNPSSASSPPPPPQPSPSAPPSQNALNQAINVRTTPQASSNLFTQLERRQPSVDAPSISGLSSNSTKAQLKRSRPSETLNQGAVDEPLDVWEDGALEGAFRITLDSEKTHDVLGHKLRYVGGVRQDLEEQGAALKLTIHVLDQAIVEVASNLGKSTPLNYLLPCWKRLLKQSKALKSKSDDRKLGVIKEARRICMSYCVFAVTIPDQIFQLEPTTSCPLTSHLLIDQDDDVGIDHDFLLEITSRFSEDDTAQEAMVAAVEDLSRRLAKLSMNDDYKHHILALRNLVRYPPMVNAMVNSSLFLPSTTSAATLETETLLGPFFQISPLQSEVTTTYFSSPKTRDRGFISNSQNSLRLTLQTHQTDLLDIANHIIKTGKEPRERLLDWFALCVNMNHKRRAMQVDKATVSSDGFMINITVCLDQLCEPFMDATFSKIDRIDVEYLRRQPRVDIKEETKLDADQKTSDEYYSTQVDGQSNFISEVFFLTLAAHHYGSEAANATLSQMEKELRHMEKQIASLEADRPKFAANPAQLRMFENAVKKYKDQVDKGLSYKFAVQGVLLDDLSQTRSMQFMRYVIVWLLRLVSPEFPKRPLKLPLPEPHSLVFRCLPEYFLEDVVGNFKFIMRNMPQIITATQSDELVMLCITFLRSSEYIKNPYLKSGLVTIMFHGIWPVYGRSKGILGDLLNSLPFATEHLLHALMKFYIEAESTGTHTQFYDKFTIRYEIFQIIKCIWSSTVYQDNLAQESKVNLDFFVRFVNLLLNDVTYVLDESLSAFKKIHDLHRLLETEGDSLDPAVRTEKEELLADSKSKAKSYMQLTNETVSMLKLFTEALAASFTMPEIVQRLADMLDYNLDAMVGPKSSQLKVDNPGQYDFNPKTLLSEIVDVYLNLRDKENFVLAVARDGRSYKPENLNKATQVMERYSLKSKQEIAKWVALAHKFRRAKELDDQAEEDLGEIPDEFLDPLMFTLMEDPVILPTSKQSLDRSTIRSHLLSDPNDPFNRSPLKIEDVIPDTEMKARIEAFKAEKKGRKIAESDLMDMSVG